MPFLFFQLKKVTFIPKINIQIQKTMKNYIQYFYDGGKYTSEQIKEQQKFLKENYGYNGAIDGLWTMKDRSIKSEHRQPQKKLKPMGI